MRHLLVLAALAMLAALTACTPAPAAAPAPVVDVVPVLVAPPAGLDIPAIGVHTTGITDLVLDEDGALEIPQDAGTVGWYPLGPAPGEVGPAVLTGHVNYAGQQGVFARLHELQPGDRVDVPRADGTTARFVVYAVDQHAKDAFPTEQVYGDTDVPALRLITCGGALDGHSYRDNVIVSARLAT